MLCLRDAHIESGFKGLRTQWSAVRIRPGAPISKGFVQFSPKLNLLKLGLCGRRVDISGEYAAITRPPGRCSQSHSSHLATES
jgi:hypothetical protein